MTEAEAMRLLQETGAVQDGHFVLSSGLHSARYFQCAQVLQYPERTERLCKALAERMADLKAGVVAGPAFGGIIVAYELARQLGVRSIFAERENGRMTFRRGFDVARGERAIIAEDVITTGGSVMEVAAALQSLGAEVVGIAVLLDRRGGADPGEALPRSAIPPSGITGIRLEALAHATVETYSPQACPLCARGLAVTKPGSRRV
jgi:orotate phosphoribosyltransferase